MDELVQRFHLEDGHSSMQVIERLAWAVEDAEGAGEADGTSSARPSRGQPGAARHLQTA